MKVRRFERRMAGLGGVVFLGFTLGCMSLNFGGRTEVVSVEDTSGLQRGKAHLSGGQEQLIYYPAPYATPPNLEFDDDMLAKGAVQIIEQRQDCFRVKNTAMNPVDLAWKARGTKASAPASAAAVVAPGSLPTTMPATQSPIVSR